MIISFYAYPYTPEPYKEFIVQRLSLYPYTSAAQMHDWLKENYPKRPALSPKTVYNYVMKLRSDYSIPKVTIRERQYKALQAHHNPQPHPPKRALKYHI